MPSYSDVSLVGSVIETIAKVARGAMMARKIKRQMAMLRNRKGMEKTARKQMVNVQRTGMKKNAAVSVIETEIGIVASAGKRNATETMTAIVEKIDENAAVPVIVVNE